MAIAFLNGTKHIPAAIAPSAVGIRGQDLKAYSVLTRFPLWSCTAAMTPFSQGMATRRYKVVGRL